jgi:hypothetical protein
VLCDCSHEHLVGLQGFCSYIIKVKIHIVRPSWSVSWKVIKKRGSVNEKLFLLEKRNLGKKCKHCCCVHGFELKSFLMFIGLCLVVIVSEMKNQLDAT